MAIASATGAHEVLEVDRRRREACISGDVDALARIMSEDCVYVHSSGASETRAQMIGRLTSGDLVYHALDLREASVRDYGDVALVNGDLHIDVTTGGSKKDFTSRFLQVWRRTDGRWQMISWQSTLLPGV
jgi:ketosteroid isomerase-like protein